MFILGAYSISSSAGARTEVGAAVGRSTLSAFHPLWRSIPPGALPPGGTLPMSLTLSAARPSVLVNVPSTPSITGCRRRYRSNATRPCACTSRTAAPTCSSEYAAISSIRKSTSRASRCRMPRICTAPSAGPDCGLGGGAGLTGTAFEYPNACAMSAGSSPPNRMEKKLRKANETRLTLDLFFFYVWDSSRIHLVSLQRPIIGIPMRKRYVFGSGLVLLAFLVTLVVWQVSFTFGEYGPSDVPQTFTFWAISTLIFLGTVTLGFMLFRTGVKLYLERRSNREGSRIQSKMVVGAVVLSLLPVVFLVLFSYAILNRNLDKWFSRPGEGIQLQLRDTAIALGDEVQGRAQALVDWLAALPEVRNGTADFATLCRENRIAEIRQIGRAH